MSISVKRTGGRKEETRQALLVAARDVFTEVGFRSANTQEIAKRVGVTKKTLYNHFPSKEDLFNQVLVQELTQSIQSVLQAQQQASTVAQKLRATLRASYEFFRSRSLIQRLVFNDMRFLPVNTPPVDYVRVMDLARKTLIEPLIPEAIREGLVRPELAGAFVNMCRMINLGMLAMIYVHDDPTHMDKLLDDVVDVLLAGVAPAPERMSEISPAPNTLVEMVRRELGLVSDNTADVEKGAYRT